MQDMMNQMMGISGSKKEKKGDKSATCLLEEGSKVVLRPLFVQASSFKHLSIEPAVSRFTLRGPYV